MKDLEAQTVASSDQAWRAVESGLPLLADIARLNDEQLGGAIRAIPIIADIVRGCVALVKITAEQNVRARGRECT
jgi:hypothetical protein